MTIRVGFLEIGNVLLCEEIRQEKSNKYIIIGVYSGDIVVSQVPARVPLAVFFDGVILKAGEIDFQIKYAGPGEGEAIIGAQLRSTEDHERFTIPVPRVDVLMEEEGQFRIEVRSTGTEWIRLIEKKVSVGEVTGPSFSAAPPPEQSPPNDLAKSSQHKPSSLASRKRRRS